MKNGLNALFLLLLAINCAACAPAVSRSTIIEHTRLQPPAAPQAGQTPTAEHEKFDGVKLYRKAFEEVRNRHLALINPAKRDKWASEWENRFAASKSLTTPEGTDQAIREMLSSLGHRYDSYMDEEETRAVKAGMDATLVGIGIVTRLKGFEEVVKKLSKNATRTDVRAALLVTSDHPILIQEVLDGSPAERAGVRAGDILRAVDGDSVEGLTLHQAIGKLRGKEGTVVTVTVERQDSRGVSATLSLVVTRAQIVVKVVKFKQLDDGIAYIKLANFSSQHALDEMQQALSKAAGARGLILDLRDNPGGRVTAAATIAAHLLPEGVLMVLRFRKDDDSLENRLVLRKLSLMVWTRSASDPGVVRLTPNLRPELLIPAKAPLVVLVNERSASASELVAGALKHTHRAVIVGKATVGKGVGQTVVDLPYSRQIHVTTFEFLPGGKSINGVGVIPDIVVNQSAGTNEDKQLKAAQDVIANKLRQQARHGQKSRMRK